MFKCSFVTQLIDCHVNVILDFNNISTNLRVVFNLEICLLVLKLFSNEKRYSGFCEILTASINDGIYLFLNACRTNTFFVR